MKTSQSFRIYFTIKSDKAKDGKAPLYVSVTVNKEKSFIALKQLVSTALWDFGKGAAKGSREEANVPLLPKALDVVNKYRENERALYTKTVFPVISNQKVNSYLKEIAELCTIHKNLTFHMARHTFATTVTLSNGVPIETVSKILGHSKVSTTQIYARVLEKKLQADMRNLKEKLASK